MRFLYFLVIIILFSEVSAQKDSVVLKQIDVSSARIPAEFNQKMRSVVVISYEEIKEIPATSLDEILEYALNTDVRQRGAFGMQSDISIRGGSSEQLAVMLNGVRINDPQTGHHNLNIPLDLGCVSRIEILQGPGTRMYGPGAFSGAVNIITAVPDSSGANVLVEAGDFEYLNAGGMVFCKNKKVSGLLSGGFKRSSGYRYNTDFVNSNIFSFVQHQSQKGTITTQAGYNDKAFGANSFYSPDYPDQFEQTRAFISSVRFDSKGKLHLRPQIYYRRHQDRFELFRDGKNAASWYAGHNYHLTHVFGGEISSWIGWKAGKTSFGGDFRSESVFNNKLGTDLMIPVPVPVENNAVFTKFTERDIATIYADHQVTLNRVTCSGGVMGYYSRQTDLKFFPGIDLGLDLTKKVSVYASFNRSLRLPSFTEMYYTSPQHIANKNLVPEEASNTEAGFRFSDEGLNCGISFYYRDGRNIIDWVRVTTSEKWTTANITSLKSYGTEFYTRVYLPHYFGNSFVRTIDLSGIYNFSSKASGDYFSMYALDFLKYKFSASVQHRIYRNFSASWTWQYQEREGTYTDRNRNETGYPSFFTVDGRVSWKKGKIRIYADASNILNTDYIDIGNVPMPGRWFRMGIVYQPSF